MMERVNRFGTNVLIYRPLLVMVSKFSNEALLFFSGMSVY
jgi:hypothetical protein